MNDIALYWEDHKPRVQTGCTHLVNFTCGNHIYFSSRFPCDFTTFSTSSRYLMGPRVENMVNCVFHEGEKRGFPQTFTTKASAGLFRTDLLKRVKGLLPHCQLNTMIIQSPTINKAMLMLMYCVFIQTVVSSMFWVFGFILIVEQQFCRSYRSCDICWKSKSK